MKSWLDVCSQISPVHVHLFFKGIGRLGFYEHQHKTFWVKAWQSQAVRASSSRSSYDQKPPEASISPEKTQKNLLHSKHRALV